MTVQHLACLLLGSNIEPEENIPRTVALLKEQLPVLRLSTVWESASAECCYPNYLNLAIQVSTVLDADHLKQQILLPLEAYMGRVRTADKNASRTIDIDIILFDGEVVDPGLWQQVYLAVPVAELIPDQLSPEGIALKDIAIRLAKLSYIQARQDIVIHLN